MTKRAVIAKRSKRGFDPKEFVATVTHWRSLTRHAKGDIIYRQEAVADAVYYVQDGRIKITVASQQGKGAIIAILGPGEFFGEGCLIGQPLRLATAEAMVESNVLRLGKTEMIRVLHMEPSFGEFFMKHLLTRNSRIEEDLIDQLFNSTEKRLARTLLLLANFGKDGGPQPITAPVSQETLAEIMAQHVRGSVTS